MTKPDDGRPFRSRPLTRKEEREVARRRELRAAARALAMPAPEASHRVDITKPGPLASATAPHGQVRFPSPAILPAVTTAQAEVKPVRRAGTATSLADAIAVAGSGPGEGGSFESRVARSAVRFTRAWGSRASRASLLLGLSVAVGSVCVGVGVGGPVLGHSGRPLVALAGAAGLGIGLLLVGKGWRAGGRHLRVVASALALLLASSFVVGVLTNPVVVDGQVFLSTSVKARSFRLIQDVRSDLLELADYDRYLTYDEADAGAHFDEYEPLTDRLKVMSEKYATMTESVDALPDERFAPVIEQAKAASYWAYRATLSKVETLEADNAKSEADLADARSSFASSLLASGQALQSVATSLNLPLTSMGPHE